MYLMIILLGLFAEMFVRQRLLVGGDILATAANLQAHQLLWRFGVAAELLSLMCVTVLSLTWLTVLRPVNRDVAWVAIFFALTAHAVGAVASVQTLGALFPLSGASWLSAFTPPSSRHCRASLSRNASTRSASPSCCRAASSSLQAP